MAFVVFGFYGLLAFVSLLNLLLMRRPQTGEGPDICILIPARDEADNLARLLPALKEQAPGIKIYVFDDASTDGTGDVAASAGATVLRGNADPPPGWTGKNWACHSLAQAVAEDSSAEWWLFLDADVRPTREFVAATRHVAANLGRRAGMITGFPQMLPGRGFEPLFLAWVPWALLTSNPFGLVARTGRGHNGFKNGQVHLWRASLYTEMWPHEAVKGRIMEDVSIGRLLAKRRVRVEVLNLSRVLAVRMYETWRQALDGMSKNSFEITGTGWGTALLATFYLFVGWAWLLAGLRWPWALALLTLGGVGTAAIVRARLWPFLLMPLVASVAALTLLRSWYWKRSGRTTWKGRTYS